MRRGAGSYGGLHEGGGEGGVAVDAALAGEAAVGFDYEGVGEAGFTVEAVDVLGEVFEEEVFAVEEGDEGVGDCGAVFSGVELLG